MRDNPAVEDIWRDAIEPMTDPVDPAFVRALQEGTVTRPAPAGFVDMAVRESLLVTARVWKGTFAEFRRTDFTRELAGSARPRSSSGAIATTWCRVRTRTCWFRRSPARG